MWSSALSELKPHLSRDVLGERTQRSGERVGSLIFFFIGLVVLFNFRMLQTLPWTCIILLKMSWIVNRGAMFQRVGADEGWEQCMALKGHWWPWESVSRVLTTEAGLQDGELELSGLILNGQIGVQVLGYWIWQEMFQEPCLISHIFLSFSVCIRALRLWICYWNGCWIRNLRAIPEKEEP